jgi:hypothetical protein
VVRYTGLFATMQAMRRLCLGQHLSGTTTNVFDHASIGMTPFTVRVEGTKTVIARSHDDDALAPARQLVFDGINLNRLGSTR